MPFAGYEDFDACVAANADKDDPSAYCAAIKERAEKRGGWLPASRREIVKHETHPQDTHGNWADAPDFPNVSIHGGEGSWGGDVAGFFARLASEQMIKVDRDESSDREVASSNDLKVGDEASGNAARNVFGFGLDGDTMEVIEIEEQEDGRRVTWRHESGETKVMEYEGDQPVTLDRAAGDQRTPGISLDGKPIRTAAKQTVNDRLAAKLMEREDRAELVEVIRANSQDLVGRHPEDEHRVVEDATDSSTVFFQKLGGRVEDLLEGDFSDDEIEEAYLRQASRKIVDRWAGTSSDSDTKALRFQKAVANVMGHDVEQDSFIGEKIDQRVEDSEIDRVYEAVAQAVYDSTQDALEAAGIDRVTLHRGMGLPTEQREEARQAEFEMNPASSFSLERGTARAFASGYPGGGLDGWMMETTVDREDIFSTAVTGPGSLKEAEIIVPGNARLNSLSTELLVEG